jgi:imidazolonepropionase
LDDLSTKNKTMSVLITNIHQLVQVHKKNIMLVSGDEMKNLPVLENAYVYIEHDTIIEYGPMSDCDGFDPETTIDATGKLVLPSWCDSHTHIVYAGDRSEEFIDKITGLSYEDISKKGGGILNSAKQVANLEEAALYSQAIKRLNDCIAMGTGAIEIKTGYGLDTTSELKLLRTIGQIKKDTLAYISPTLLAAHAIPEKYKKDKEAYIQLIINELIPKASELKIAKFIDVFCEEGYFDVEDMNRILDAGNKYQLKPKVHVNQFNVLGGVEAAVHKNALSVDHLELLSNEDIKALKKSDTIPVALPGCSFYLDIPYTPARKLIEAGLPLALATDFNPGSAPSGNMNFILSLACIKMGLSPEEAINAATINGAYAMNISSMYGSITRGKKANLIITKPMNHYREIPYYFSHNPIDQIIINGELWP